MTNGENIIENLRKMAAVSEEDYVDSFTDDFRVIYSKDGKRLLSGRDLRKCRYIVKEGTEVICDGAFENSPSIKIAELPKSLRYIGDRAFQSTFIDEITFPDGLLGIGQYAYAFSLGDVKKLIIPDSVIYVGRAAFYRMYNLKAAVVGSGLTTIPEKMFAWCYEMKGLSLPDTIEVIGNLAFFGCSIKKGVIPPRVNKIGTNPFWGARTLECLSDNFLFEDNVLYSKDRREIILSTSKKKRFVVPDGIKFIGPFAFANAKAEEVTLPESVSNIGKKAFMFSNLKKFRFPQGIKSIDERAFFGLDIESLDLPDGIRCIGKRAFEDCKKLKKIHLPDSLEEIGANAFWDCCELDSVVLPKKIKAIGDSAFGMCEKLGEMTLPESIESIGANPFERIQELHVVCETHNYRIEDGVLYSTDGKEVVGFIGNQVDVHIAEGAEVIRANAFNSRHIVSISLPSSLQRIEQYAFFRCEDLRDVIIPDSVSYIGESAFHECRSLNVSSLPSNLEEICAYTFMNSGISGIKLPETLVVIGDYAFSCCGRLKRVKIPSRVKVIGECAFNACRSLESVSLPPRVEIIGSAAFRLCESLKEIHLPPITELADQLFQYSCSLTDIYIPDTVQRIGRNVFVSVRPNYEILSPRIAEMVKDAEMDAPF